MNATTALRLNVEEVTFYQSNGYYLFRQRVFSPEKFTKLYTIFEDHLHSAEGIRSDELDTPHFRDPRLFEFLMADEVLDLVEPVIGPNIALWSSHFISKEPFTGRATPWHEDSAYWKGRFDRLDQIVTVWLAIDPADEENGCMRVIPGTHRNGFSEYETTDTTNNTFSSQIRTDLVDESKSVYFELQANQCSLHDSRIIHGAKANTSPRRRCGYTMRYFSQTMRFIPERNVGHKIWHCRGENVANNPVEALPVW
jgi:chlorinating enzyme